MTVHLTCVREPAIWSPTFVQEKRKRHAKEIASAQLGYSGVKALEEGKAGGILPQYDVEEDFKDKSKEVVLGEDGSAARAEKVRRWGVECGEVGMNR